MFGCFEQNPVKTISLDIDLDRRRLKHTSMIFVLYSVWDNYVNKPSQYKNAKKTKLIDNISLKFYFTELETIIWSLYSKTEQGTFRGGCLSSGTETILLMFV